jgi:hypothetical protein
MSPLAILWRRISGNGPLLISVILHAVLILAAALFVVSETVVGKKKRFEAPPAAEAAPARRQVEHRIQTARKSGAVQSAPVATKRILSTATDGLVLPALPDLPFAGASALGGLGGFGQGMGLGQGAGGMGTSLANAGLGGRGFMSLSFLGLTDVKAQRVVFVVDVGRSLMDIRKGGFQAFGIIRAEILRLVGNLPPSAQFGVVLFDGSNLALYADALRPATVKNKTAFFAWLEPVNAKLDALGIASAGGATAWTREMPDGAGLDPDYNGSPWINAVHAALQMRPDTVFAITGAAGYGSKRLGEGELTGRARSRERELAALRAQGLDLAAVTKARRAALAAARAELEAFNQRLVAQGRDPLVVTESRRIMDADFQAALKRAGGNIKMDTTGWADREGRPVWIDSEARTSEVQPASVTDAAAHLGRLQAAFLRERAALHLFYFVGPDDRPQGAMDGLARLAPEHGGRFELLTTKRLEALAARR